MFWHIEKYQYVSIGLVVRDVYYGAFFRQVFRIDDVDLQI